MKSVKPAGLSSFAKPRGFAKSAFFPTKSKALARIIRIDTIPHARQSVTILKARIKSEKTRPARLRTFRATVLASTRAKIIAQNPRNTFDERLQSAEVARIYAKAYKAMSLARSIKSGSSASQEHRGMYL